MPPCSVCHFQSAALKIKDSDAGGATQRKCVQCQLLDRTIEPGIRLVSRGCELQLREARQVPQAHVVSGIATRTIQRIENGEKANNDTLRAIRAGLHRTK
jgi:hypothetical protein